MIFSPPEFESLSDYYKSYWKYFNEEDLLAALTNQGKSTMDWLSSIPVKVENVAYSKDKWMLKEVIGHLSDTERILAYRALRFARNDKTPLTSFDENNFVLFSNFSTRSLKDITNEWKTVRSATLSLFSSMTDEFADRMGIASGVTLSPRIILYFIIVHERHHINVIKERYLTSAISS